MSCYRCHRHHWLSQVSAFVSCWGYTNLGIPLYLAQVHFVCGLRRLIHSLLMFLIVSGFYSLYPIYPLTLHNSTYARTLEPQDKDNITTLCTNWVPTIPPVCSTIIQFNHLLRWFLLSLNLVLPLLLLLSSSSHGNHLHWQRNTADRQAEVKIRQDIRRPTRTHTSTTAGEDEERRLGKKSHTTDTHFSTWFID